MPDPISGLRKRIKKTLDARAEAITHKTISARSKRWIEEIFTAIGPFAKNVLLVAKDGTNVIS